MSPIVYLPCPRCARLPRPNCTNCSGLNGTYVNQEQITPNEEDLNRNHIYTIEIQYKKAIEKQFWPAKLRSYFSESLLFLEQFPAIATAHILISKIKRSLKFQLLREIRSTLMHLKSHPNIEYIESLGFETRIRGNCISYMEHPDVLRISLFSKSQPILKPKLRVIDVKLVLMKTSIYNLSSKDKVHFTNSTHILEPIQSNSLAVVKISQNDKAEYYYLLRNEFDAILNSI